MFLNPPHSLCSMSRLNNNLSRSVSKIGFAFNAKKTPGKSERADKYAEFDEPETIEAITKVLSSAGYKVFPLEADENFIEKVKEVKPDFVFNLAEGYSGEGREAYVPVVLDALDIPYSGSGPAAQVVTLVKSITKDVLAARGIPTPKYQVFASSNGSLNPDLNYPLIVKPDAEGSSKGINSRSIVHYQRELKRQVEYVVNHYHQDALVEKMCTGREFTIAILGNPPRVMPIVEITLEEAKNGSIKIDGWEEKWIYDTPEHPADLKCPADIPKKLQSRLEKIALATFSALDCADFTRMDIRLDEKGVPNVLDVNALPGLMPDPKKNSRFPIARYATGMTYKDIIIEILHSAFKHYNIRPK